MSGQRSTPVTGLLAIATLFAGLAPALATAGSEDNFYSGLHAFGDLLLPKGTQITIGGGPQFGPDYFGSDDYEVEADLVFFLRFGRFLTLENDGASFNILGVKDFQLGPVVRISGGRDESENPALEGLGDIGASLDVGAFVKANVADRLIARLRYFRAVGGADNGGLADVTLSALLYKKDDFSVAMSLRGSWAGKTRAEQFFSISAEQSARSGLPEFSTGASAQDARVSVGARWEFATNWSLNGFARYSRLLGDIADSPIVDPSGSANQFTIGSYVAYTFQFD